jgi:DNA uptake protein ComE-like DNA-binding protein
MASEGKSRASAADAWLIEGAQHESDQTNHPEDHAPGPEAKQWLAVPEPDLRRRREPEPADRRAPANAARVGGERRLSSKLARAEELIQEQRDEIADLGRRIRDLQTELRMHAKADRSKKPSAKPPAPMRRRKTATTQPTSARTRKQKTGTQARAKRSTSRRRTRRKNGELDLNAASFEELRGLGLSVTQSARLIAYRDVRGGYNSLNELDDIPGLSKETRTELRTRLILSS